MDLLVFMSAIDAVDWSKMLRKVLVNVSHCQGREHGPSLLAVTFVGDDTVGLGNRTFFYLVKLRKYYMNRIIFDTF